MKKVIILDYSRIKVIVLSITKEQAENIELLENCLILNGFKLSQISYMIAKKINLLID